MSGDLVGTVVGKYKVVSKIGTGGMGDVYEAMDVDGGWTDTQSVALKVLRVDDETLASRFLREAKTMSLFAHPNIVELVEVGKLDDGRLYFAAELVRGDTLRTLIDRGPVEPKRALAITRQILEALGHAHAMGVVHRDIKPENVMLVAGSNDVVKILDFGVAKLIGDTPAVLGEGTLTITGYGALGTPYYISPEAVLGRPLDARADLYSIGVLLFEMLTGTPPYMHDDVAVLMRMHAAAPIPPVPDATPGLALVVSEALAKKPDLRFKSAAEMIDAVDAAARSLEEPKKSTDLFGALPLGTDQAPQPEAHPDRAKPRANLPGVAPYQTPTAGSPVVQQARLPSAPPVPAISHGPAMPPAQPYAPPAQPWPAPPSHGGGPVIGVVVPASGHNSAPLFAPPMPHAPHAPQPPNKLLVLAHKHRKLMFAGMGVFVLIIIIAIVALKSGGGGKSTTTATKTEAAPAKRADLVRGAQELIAAGHPGRAVELIEREDVGDDAETLLVLGHARIGANRRLDALAAYERAIKLDKKLAADAQLRTNLARVLDTKDAVAGVVALEVAMRLDPPAQDLVKLQAGNGKIGDVRRRAMAIAEREKFSEGIDRVDSWSLDLAQASNCEDRLAAIVKLRRIADPRAIPALKRAKTHRCVEREVAEAIAYLESRPATP
ncbi:MAG: protein kinase [Myxococcota bacterium]|nr:protein kinase [Myxococcota bacterium]